MGLAYVQGTGALDIPQIVIVGIAGHGVPGCERSGRPLALRVLWLEAMGPIGLAVGACRRGASIEGARGVREREIHGRTGRRAAATHYLGSRRDVGTFWIGAAGVRTGRDVHAGDRSRDHIETGVLGPEIRGVSCIVRLGCYRVASRSLGRRNVDGHGGSGGRSRADAQGACAEQSIPQARKQRGHLECGGRASGRNRC